MYFARSMYSCHEYTKPYIKPNLPHCVAHWVTESLHSDLQVSTHNMHSSSEDDDMESPFPNDLSLQQVTWAGQIQNKRITWCRSRPAGGAKSHQADFHPLLQAFSDYQIQQMTANFVDQFGFNDEEFSEHDENIKLVETKKQVRPGRRFCTCFTMCYWTLSRVPCGHGKPRKVTQIGHGKVGEFCKITEFYEKTWNVTAPLTN